MEQMTNRERFSAVMNFKPFDRLPVVEWAPWWNVTVDRWHNEGLPKNLTGGTELCDYFGLDRYYQFHLTARRFPHLVEGPAIIKDEADYEALLKEGKLFPEDGLLSKEDLLALKKMQNNDVVTWFTFEGFFWFPRVLFGIEPHLYSFYDYPELYHRINEDLTRFMIRQLERIYDVFVPDFMSFSEDMSYNHGPMLSKALYDEFMLPYYKQVTPLIKSAGTLAIIDSDGDITTAAPWFIESGLDGILPLERQAGVDVALLREKHPTLRFLGCFDKMTMNQGKAAMRAEFERLLPVAKGGGLVISCDHQTPPHTSLEDYKLYTKLFFEYAKKAGA